MSRWLSLAAGSDADSPVPPDSQTKPDKTLCEQPKIAFCQVLSGCQVEGTGIRGNCDTEGELPKKQTQEGTVSRLTSSETPTHFSFGGRAISWTGKIVSLEDWRALTAWERHGPNGRHWNGITRQWEWPK
ncbi:MAG: hypothetical protein ABJ251_12375 [Paracoccaceae bacterium]